MTKILNKFYKTGTAILALGLLLVAVPAVAHQDPGSCDSNALTMGMTVFRADETTVISGGGTVQSGETVKYRVTLSHGGGSNCNFEGGVLSIITPDGVSHEMTNPVPLVSFGSPHVSGFQSYVVSEGDVVSGNIQADATYTGGVSHTGDQHDNASAAVDRNTPYQDVSLEVTKTADEESEITYDWTIDKSVTPATWDLFNGDSGTSEYTITLNKSVGTTSHSVTGTITIHNPALFANATVTSVTDSISGVGAVTVVCPGIAPYVIAPGADLICTYSSVLPDSSTRPTTATAVTSGDVG